MKTTRPPSVGISGSIRRSAARDTRIAPDQVSGQRHQADEGSHQRRQGHRRDNSNDSQHQSEREFPADRYRLRRPAGENLPYRIRLNFDRRDERITWRFAQPPKLRRRPADQRDGSRQSGPALHRC